MKRFLGIVLFVGLLLACVGSANAVELFRGRAARNSVSGADWNAPYYKPEWGMPLAVVVPPTAERYSNYGWGVGNYRATPLSSQFHRDYPGPGHYDCRLFMPTPAQPSDTMQMGVYPVRGPW